MGSVTNNKASTKLRIALPEQMLPVVIEWPTESKDRSGVGLFGVSELGPRELGLYMANKKKFEETYGATTADEKELLYLLRMSDAIADKSLPRLKKALERFIGKAEAEKEFNHPAGFHAIYKLCFRFNTKLHSAHPIVYWSDRERRPVFALHCPDTATALYLLALRSAGMNSMGRCKACLGILIRDRANKQFCDGKCRSRYFMRQLRERQKKARKKGKAKR